MPKVYTGDLTKMFDIKGKKAVIFGGAGGFTRPSQKAMLPTAVTSAFPPAARALWSRLARTSRRLLPPA